MTYTGLILEGLTKNLLITLLSIQLPLGVGILLTVFANMNRTVAKVFSWISLPAECLCPIVVLSAVYFNSGLRNAAEMFIFSALIFSFCFIGYMPARHYEGYSFLKNILYNGLGLLSSVYKWSFCVGFIGMMDLLRAAQVAGSREYSGAPYWIVLAISVVILLIVETGRRFVKNLMK